MIDRERLGRARGLGYPVLFGDRVGLLLFLGSLCLFLALWRTAFLINDSYTIANGLAAVANGDLSLTTAEYGGLDSPGAARHGGAVYSRNYGVIVLSLPFLYALRAVEAVADLRIALVGVWSLLLYATVLVAGRQFGRERLARIGGGVAVAALFVANVALASPLDPVPHHQLALQLFHATVAAFVGTLAYRLVTATDGRRLGVVAAVGVLGGTPLAFWASVPKRHVISAGVVLAVAVALLYSRDRSHEWAFEARAACYVLLALLAWIHAPEALLLFVPFVLVDVATAPDNSVRTLATLGLAFSVALVPLLVTNTLITGDPLTVPRMLRTVPQEGDISLSGGSSSGGGGGGSGGSLLPSYLLPIVALLQSAIEPLAVLYDLVASGVLSLFREPTAAYQSLVRSGYVDRVGRLADGTAEANLTLLESAPLLAPSLTAIPVALATAKRTLARRSLSVDITAADVYLTVSAVIFILAYISRLPLHAQVTVRYLFPVTPMLVCLIVRLPPIRRALGGHWRTTLWSVAGGVLIGGQLVLVALVALDVGRGEAFQFHALLGLAVAAALGTWSLLAVVTDRLDRVGAALFGLAVASTSVFVCFAAVEYFGLGSAHALPLARAVADAIPLR